MDNPNTIAKIITGTKASIGPEGWNTSVMTPRDAPMLNKFSKAAFNGTNSDRNTTINNKADKPTTTRMNSGNRELTADAKSSAAAVDPPTRKDPGKDGST